MPHKDNIIAFGDSAAVSRRHSLGTEQQRVVKECRGIITRTLPRLLAGLFERLDDALYELADKSDSNALQSGYFSAMRDIRKERHQVEKEFSTKILVGYDRFWQLVGSAFAANIGDEDDGFLASDLALVGDDELEESLAVNNMISKGENRYHSQLYALEHRFACILPGIEIDNQSNPLAPAAFCNAFRDTIRTMELDIPVKLVIYKLFDKQVMHYAGALYDELNAAFAHAGFMPRLSPKVQKNKTNPNPFRQEHRHESTSRGFASKQDALDLPPRPDYSYQDETAEEVQAEVFRALQNMLNARRGGGNSLAASPEAVSLASLPIVDTGDLVSALSSLQHSNVAFIGSAPIGDLTAVNEIRSKLSEELNLVRNGEAHKAIGQADDDTIDVIAMLFEFILEDKNIPDAMKVLLGRLQIPMLKVAIMDKSFFSKKLHPARRLLNNLARAAIGWNDEGGDRRSDTLYLKIESVVNRILVDFEDDSELFVKLDQEFSEYLEKEQRGAEVTEERTTQVTRGKEQLKAAKQRVAFEISSRLDAHIDSVPEVVGALLQEGWKDVLLLNYLRQGPDSDAWQNSINLIDKLLWSVEPKANFSDRQELLKEIPDLLKKIREGLTGISYDQHKMAHLLKELQGCHIACLRGGGQVGNRTWGDTSDQGNAINRMGMTQQGLSAEKKETIAGIDRLQRNEGQQIGSRASAEGAPGGDERMTRDSYVDLAENLSVGTWLDIYQEDGPKIRAKLSWKSDVSDAYVFVNRRGVKVSEMTMQNLALAFRSGKIQILSEVNVPLMDRALTAVMKSLESQEA